MDPPVRMLERIDDAIDSLDITFERALETFALLRRGGVPGSRRVKFHPEGEDPIPTQG